jgi:hypothetical protein
MTHDTEKIATLVRHWMEHNEGHRQSYLDWKEKLLGAGLPETVGALERVAALTDEMNRELDRAARELERELDEVAGSTAGAAEAGQAHSPAHDHRHDHGHEHSH